VGQVHLLTHHFSLPFTPLPRCTSLRPSSSSVVKIFFAIFVPPLGVFLERGCTADFWIK
jgi:hypothetical protein